MSNQPHIPAPTHIKMDGYSTHLPYLVAAVIRSQHLYPGVPILELGCGLYSTPVLTHMAAELGIGLESFATDRPWAEHVNSVIGKGLGGGHHPKVTVIPTWAGWAPLRPYGVCLLDNELLIVDRFAMLPMLLEWCQCVVFHDATTAIKGRGIKFDSLMAMGCDVQIHHELPSGTAVIWRNRKKI
jgi:hypothetical protein